MDETVRVLLTRTGPYPVARGVGVGKQPLLLTSGSAQHQLDLLARGLAEDGHEIFVHYPDGVEAAPPTGVIAVEQLMFDIDVFHPHDSQEAIEPMIERGIPWVSTCSLDPRSRGASRVPLSGNWVFVSRTLAACYGSERFIHVGLDPAEYIYTADKDDYLVYVAGATYAHEKGLDIALAVSDAAGLPIVVLGSAREPGPIAAVEAECAGHDATYLGDVRGAPKAMLLARARALVFPTRVNDACPVAVLEAMMSGTPVIASTSGACPELVTPEVGFVCETVPAYVAALERIGEIDPQACRERALTNFHYRVMATRFAVEYQREIANPSPLLENDVLGRWG